MHPIAEPDHDPSRDVPAPGPGFAWTRATWGRALHCEPLGRVARHGWTTRDLALRGAEEAEVPRWAQLASEAGVAPDALVRLVQVHGREVISLERPPAARPHADGMVTARPDILLAVQVADCVPLLLADPRTGAVAAVHAGWRGTCAGIAANAIDRLGSSCGSAPEDLVAAIGPSIGPCCYEVGGDVFDAFAAAGWPVSRADAWFTRRDRLRLDLWQATRDQLVDAGVQPHQVYVSGLCTVCQASLFYSYRREGAGTGRIVGYIRRHAQSQ